MPVDHKKSSALLYQREQYKKGGIGHWYWDFKDSLILNFFKNHHKNIIDIGCGEGILIEKIARIYPDKKITGIDIMPENIEICKQYNLPVCLGSLYDLKIEDNIVDLCIFSEVIEHLKDVDLAIRNVKRILKKNGQLVIVFPNDQIFKVARLLLFRFRDAFADVGHINQFNPRSIKDFLEKAGFIVEKIQNVPFYLWRLSLHCIVLARKP